jgi:hypothetical protein
MPTTKWVISPAVCSHISTVGSQIMRLPIGRIIMLIGIITILRADFDQFSDSQNSPVRPDQRIRFHQFRPIGPQDALAFIAGVGRQTKSTL